MDISPADLNKVVGHELRVFLLRKNKESKRARLVLIKPVMPEMESLATSNIGDGLLMMSICNECDDLRSFLKEVFGEIPVFDGKFFRAIVSPGQLKKLIESPLVLEVYCNHSMSK